MIKFNVVVKDNNWFKFIKSPKSYLKKKLKKIEKDNFFHKKIYNISFQLSGSKEIKLLNKKFRNKNKSTDILSFPNHEKKELKKILKVNSNIYLGDIIINFKQIKTTSKTIFKDHFDMLWIHGLLHLFGYDHKNDYSFKKMHTIEKKFLKKISK